MQDVSLLGMFFYCFQNIEFNWTFELDAYASLAIVFFQVLIEGFPVQSRLEMWPYF